jgi:hypothetical protein
MKNWYSKYNYKCAQMPIPTDHIEDLHGEELKKALVRSKAKATLYHGTSSKKLAKILQHGALDPEVPQQDPSIKSYEGSSRGVFLTSSENWAEAYAHNASSQDGSDSVVLEVVVPYSWLDIDPDDTKYNPDTNEVNMLGKTQAMISRPLSFKHIKSVHITEWRDNSELRKVFEDAGNAFIPIGVFVDRLKKLNKIDPKTVEGEYEQMTIERKKGLSRSMAHEDFEYQIAQSLVGMMQSYFVEPYNFTVNGIGLMDFTVAYIYSHHNIYQNAVTFLREYMQSAGLDYDEYMGNLPDYLQPKPNESIHGYLARL